MIGVSQWLKYKKSSGKKVLMNLVKPLIISVVLTVLLIISYDFKYYELPRVALLFATTFAAISNVAKFRPIFRAVEIWRPRLPTSWAEVRHAIPAPTPAP